MSTNIGYTDSYDKDYIGTPYLYLGFIPDVKATPQDVLMGINTYDTECSYTRCDNYIGNYISLFPNFDNHPTNPWHWKELGWGELGPCGCIKNSLRHNPTDVLMPDDYFMFTELFWGGCACYAQSDGRGDGVILGSALGFR